MIVKKSFNEHQEVSMPFKFFLAFVAIGWLSFALVASAHHSPSNYTNTYKDIQGVVKEVHLVVPHSWVYLEVKDAKGEPQIWVMEAIGRNVLAERVGVTPDYLKVGDVVKARCYPLRDGTPGCRLGFIKAKDGSIKNWNGDNTPSPTDF
jgi:Family of unknown function (DUF6152)